MPLFFRAGVNLKIREGLALKLERKVSLKTAGFLKRLVYLKNLVADLIKKGC